MKLHYFKSPKGVGNVGDDLNAWLWERALPDFFNEDSSEIFVGIGTLLNETLPKANRTIVFGSGAGYGDAPTVDDNWKIYCVRGPLTAKKLGISEKYAVTDSALLLNRYYDPENITKKFRFSYMQHFTHVNKSGRTFQSVCNDLGFGYVDSSGTVEDVLGDILQTECLITESLHGAIIADMFRIPWIPVKTSQEILEFKWHDWCATVKTPYEPSAVMPVWDLEGHHDAITRVRNGVKKSLLKRTLQKISNQSKQYLSKSQRVEDLTCQLEEKLATFKKDRLEVAV